MPIQMPQLDNPRSTLDLPSVSRIVWLEKHHESFASYCRHCRRRGLRVRTLESYADCLLVFARWLDGESPLHATLADLERFRGWLSNEYRSPQGKGVSLGRQGYYIAVLRGYYGYCRDQGWVLTNPAADLAYPKTPKRLHRDILTPEELRRLLDAPPVDPRGLRDRVALRLMALSGLRVSEAADLELSDLNLPRRELTIRGKGGHQRLGFIDRTSQRVIASYLGASRPALASPDTRTLLVANTGSPINRHQLLAVIQRHVKAAGISKPVSCHSLRRTFGTLMLTHAYPGSGMNLKLIGELLGHAKLRTTARYAQVDIRSLSDVYRQSHPRAVHTDHRITTRGVA